MTQIFAQIIIFLPVVWAQAEQNFDGNMIQDNPAYAPTLPVGVMDPSTFTTHVTGCQQNCGDGYYRCFQSCDNTSQPKLPTKTYFEHQSKDKQWNNYLLKLLTFGYYGNKKKKDKADEVYYDLRYIGDKHGLNGDKCMKNCTKFFRICYRHCACKVRDDEKDCMSDIIKTSSKPGQVDSDSEFTARFEFIDSKEKETNKKSTGYKFDWGRLT